MGAAANRPFSANWRLLHGRRGCRLRRLEPGLCVSPCIFHVSRTGGDTAENAAKSARKSGRPETEVRSRRTAGLLELNARKPPFLNWWRGLDSNQRTLARADLQSAAFNHSATSPRGQAGAPCGGPSLMCQRGQDEEMPTGPPSRFALRRAAFATGLIGSPAEAPEERRLERVKGIEPSS